MIEEIFSNTHTDNNIISSNNTENWSAVEQKLRLSERAFNSWKSVRIAHRAEYFEKAASILENNAEKFGRSISLEMGKPWQQSIAEVKKCALVCRYYAHNAGQFLNKEYIQTEFSKSYVCYQPLGTVLQIMPFNFPFWQVFRFAAPALMAGNVSILKHAPSVPQCVQLIQSVFDAAGFPEGVFQHTKVEIKLIEKIIEHPSVQGVALTGSTTAGQAVGSIAGKNIKNCVLELGGSDPFIVLEDADLEMAATVAVKSRMHNSGQTCISAKRFILHQSVAAQFKDLVRSKMQELIVGDPFDPSTNISALARPDLAIKLQKQVDMSVKMGAVIEVDGGHKSGTSYFYPMMLSNLKKGMPAFEEELFGPVVCIFEVKNDKEAIQLANNTCYGLAATVWTKDLGRAQNIAEQLEVGAVAINKIMSSDPRIPFGGVKMSGIGRELGREGILSFVNIKSITVS